MSSWDDFRRWCFHGVREGLDSHDCHECQEIAKEVGDYEEGNTYCYVKDPRNKSVKKKRK